MIGLHDAIALPIEAPRGADVHTAKAMLTQFRASFLPICPLMRSSPLRRIQTIKHYDTEGSHPATPADLVGSNCRPNSSGDQSQDRQGTRLPLTLFAIADEVVDCLLLCRFSDAPRLHNRQARLHVCVKVPVPGASLR